MELIFAYIGALFVGITLGLFGGGGSILTVPILVYLLNLNPVTATAYSLFVVGSTSLVGAISNMFRGMVMFKIAVVFALPAFTTVYLTRRYLVPAIPEEIFTIGGFTLSKGVAIMIFFAFIMLLASISMIKDREPIIKVNISSKLNIPLILSEGILVGFLTGMVGAGGGFLIIPVLVLLANLPMKKAVATSLFIVAVNSLIGFLGDVQNISIDWPFLLTFTLISIIGIFIGIYLTRFIDGKPLKKAFGWFVLAMGIYIIVKELVLS